MHKNSSTQMQLRPANDAGEKRPPSRTAFIGIDYDEGNASSYRGVNVSVYDQDHKKLEDRLFDDWDSACVFADTNADKVFYLSSVDHFKADGGLTLN